MCDAARRPRAEWPGQRRRSPSATEWAARTHRGRPGARQHDGGEGCGCRTTLHFERAWNASGSGSSLPALGAGPARQSPDESARTAHALQAIGWPASVPDALRRGDCRGSGTAARLHLRCRRAPCFPDDLPERPDASTTSSPPTTATDRRGKATRWWWTRWVFQRASGSIGGLPHTNQLRMVERLHASTSTRCGTS